MEIENTTLIALAPSEMPAAQAELATWLDGKITSVQGELAEIEQNLAIAIKHKWKHSTLKAIVGRTKGLIGFYEKMREAVKAGYLIIPSMDCSVFAIRTDRQNTKSGTFAHASSAESIPRQSLPSGEGRYVAPEATSRVDSVERETDANGKVTNVTKWYAANEFQEVAFPVSLIKPHVMDATGKAMALKIFDDIGIVRPQFSRKADPFIVGRIRDPRTFRPPQTFFIAWWLDTRSL